MRINPIYSTPNMHFKSKMPTNVISKNPTKSQQFWEATGVVAMTTVPMFIFIYLQNLFRKTFGNHNVKQKDLC